MKHSARSAMAAGVSMLAVSAAVIAPVQPTPVPAPEPTVRLAAAVQPLKPGKEPPHIPALLRSSALLETSAVQAALPGLPGVPSLFAVPIAPGLANSIDNLYLDIEPWVQYGFEVATYALAWVPYVGFLSGLIMDGYFFGESIVASAVFNFTDFLRGDGGIVENLVDFGVDVGLAFVWLGLDALATFVPLPPCNCYPPRPPVQGPFLALDTLTSLTGAAKTAGTPWATLVEKLTAPAGVGADEAQGEQVASLGGEPTQQQGVPEKKTFSEQVGEFVSQFVKDDPEQVEEVVNTEEDDADLVTDELTTKTDEEDSGVPTTTKPKSTVATTVASIQERIRSAFPAKKQKKDATETHAGSPQDTAEEGDDPGDGADAK
jgi:hypothetical protein